MFLSVSFGICRRNGSSKKKQTPGVDQKRSSSWANVICHRKLHQNCPTRNYTSLKINILHIIMEVWFGSCSFLLMGDL